MDPRDSEKTVKAFAFKVMRRLMAAGAASHLIEDVQQELWIAWCKARDSYDPAGGASFKTYLYNGMRMHINRWAEQNVSKRHAEVIALSIDYEMDDGASFESVLPSGEERPDEIVERQSNYELVFANLAPRARRFVEILRDPPEQLVAELRALEARAAYGKQLGVNWPSTNRITSAMVFDLLGISRTDRTKIANQIRAVGEALERANA